MLLATVKGDVHDIGKNIVGVVLGCNDYEVLDLGVMVSTETILETAERERVDVVGLSGLITPSLDHMVEVAKEMARRRLELPLLIGGATTSRQHTAVKIAPEYENETVHVLDASRVVDVVARLLDPGRRAELDGENRELQERLRVQHAEKIRKPLLILEAARANRVQVPFDDLPVPPFVGLRDVAPTLEELGDFIDWQFFFHAWDLKGKFPAILDNPAARELYDDATTLLAEITRDKLLQARGVHGYWPAHAEGDDIVVADTRFCFLRQQADHARRASEPLPRRLRRSRGRPRRCVRRLRPRRRRALGTLRGRARRLSRDHRQGARRPPGRGLRRVAPPPSAASLVRAGRAPAARRRLRGSASAVSGPPSATPPAPTTARRASCSTCSGQRMPGCV